MLVLHSVGAPHWVTPTHGGPAGWFRSGRGGPGSHTLTPGSHMFTHSNTYMHACVPLHAYLHIYALTRAHTHPFLIRVRQGGTRGFETLGLAPGSYPLMVRSRPLFLHL